MSFSRLPKLFISLAVVALACTTKVTANPSATPATQPSNKVHSNQPTAPLSIYELTSSLKVNGRILGPQKLIISGKKTHIAIFRESASRQYQVTYQITPKPDIVEVSAAVSTSLFKPSFQLMSGQQVSARQTPDLPEIEVIFSAKKLSINPTNQPLPVKPNPSP